MDTIPFTKMHGIANDYIYVNRFAHPLDGVDIPELTRRISDRHRGVGSDGLILIAPPEDGVAADVRMEMYNADGSRGGMCGNGIRCVAKYAVEHGLIPRPTGETADVRVQTDRGVLLLRCFLTDEKVTRVRVNMGPPILEPEKIPVALPRRHSGPIVRFPLGKYIPIQAPAAWMSDRGLDPHMTCVSMGNPHMVVFCSCVEGVPLEMIGPFLERQNIFPDRINVHFAQVQGRGKAKMRTWERGSGITMACGTGACAVLVAGVLEKRLDRAATIHLPGGDLLIEWPEQNGETLGSVFMTGPAEEVFNGEWRMANSE